MKTITRNLTIALSALIMSGAAVGLQKTVSNDYIIVAFDNCDIVLEQTMNQEQIDAYLALQQEEDLMELAEAPIDAIEDQIEELSDQIEDLTDRAIQEDGDSLYINKVLLREKQDVIDQLDDLIELHEVDFDRISEIGERIGRKAEVFEQAIEASLQNVDYDRVKILTPDSKAIATRCHSGIIML